MYAGFTRSQAGGLGTAWRKADIALTQGGRAAVANHRSMGTPGRLRPARYAVAVLALSLVVGALGSAVAAPLLDQDGVGENLKLVAQIDYLDGTHIEHATIKGRDYI